MPATVSPASVATPTRRSIMSRRTATMTTRVRGPSGVETVPSDWKSRIASSIGTGMWSGASMRTTSSSILGVVDHRQVQRADDDALVRDAEPDGGGQLVVGEQLAQLLGHRHGVRDLAVSHDAGTELGHRAVREDREPFTWTWAAAR